jgi:hypothetical protein
MISSKDKRERLKPLSLYGLDLKEALHAMLSVDPRKLKPEAKTEQAPSRQRSVDKRDKTD